MSLVQLKDISKSFAGDGDNAELSILKGVTLEIASGESLAIVGPSGSGKSTLLNIIGALDRPTRGTVLLSGVDLGGLGERDLARVRNRQIGFVFQAHHLLPQCTVLENVLIPTLPNKESDPRAADEYARKLLNRVGLGSRLSHRPGQLSGGEKQRVAVVRALINRPKLLLADEPTGALDRASADQLAALLVELNVEEAVTLVLVTHAMELARRMKTIRELRDGVLVETAR